VSVRLAPVVLVAAALSCFGAPQGFGSLLGRGDVSYNLILRQPPAAAPATLLFDYNELRYYRLEFGGDSFRVFRVAETRERLLGEGKLAAGSDFTVRRRRWRLGIESGGRWLLDVFEPSSGPGAVLLNPPGARDQINFSYQKVVLEAFADDFMRTGEVASLTPWIAKGGKWQLHSVVERHPRADVTRSPNPFSLGGRSDEPALAVVGYDLWDDYRLAASLKSVGGEVGLAFALTAREYLLVRWDVRDVRKVPCRLQLVKVTAKEPPRPVFEASTEKVLAERWIAAATDQWYRVEVNLLGRDVDVRIDGSIVFDWSAPEPLSGAVGLYIRGGEGFFDDVEVAGRKEVQIRPRNLASLCRETWGGWTVSDESLHTQAALLPFAKTKDCGYITELDCRGLVLTTTIVGKRPSGLIFGYEGRDRWTRLQLDGAKVTLLKRDPAPRLLDQWTVKPGKEHLVTVDFREPEASVSVDGRVVFLTELPSTGVGFYGGGDGVGFRDILLSEEIMEDTEQQPRNEYFKSDPFMLLWSSPVGVWFPDESSERTYWHTSDFFGDFRFSLPSGAGSEVAFCAAEEDFATGYSLRMSGASGAEKLLLLRLGRETASAAVPAGSGGRTIWLERQGAYIRAGVDGDAPVELLRFRDPSPLDGRRVGFKAGGFSQLPTIGVWRNRVYDCLFENAPADWEKVAEWEVTNRFACDPRWSHMSGQSPQAAILWNKYEFSGDQTLEFYAGMRMQVGLPMSYPRVGDINAAICSDGRSLFSGYTFILQAWDPEWSERWTRILRRGEVVAETEQQFIPRVRLGYNWSAGWRLPVPWIAEGRPVHGAWYYIKVQKTGGRLQCYVDNRLALVYDDPDPLPGGKVALWTYNDAVMLARARIGYERKSTPPLAEGKPPKRAETLPYVPITAATVPGILSTFEEGIDGWEPTHKQLGAYLELDRSTSASGRASLKLTNPTGAGDFGAVVPLPPGDPRLIKRIEFDYKIPHDVRINLYLLIDDEWHFIRLTGPDESTNLYRRLGQIGITADDRWHHASFDLYPALMKLRPWAKSSNLTKMILGVLHPGYLQAGLGGNPGGVSYHLDNFTVVAAASAPPSISWTYQADGFYYGLDGKADSIVDVGQKSVNLTRLQDGIYEFALKAVSENAETATTRLPFAYSEKPLAVARIEPPDGSDWCDELVRIAFQPDPWAGLDPSSLTIYVGDKVYPGSLLCRFVPEAYSVEIDLARTQLSFNNKEMLDLRLGFKRVGQTKPETSVKWTYRVDYKRDSRPPQGVNVAGYRYDDFEDSLGQWAPAAGKAEGIPELASDRAASGKQCLRVYKRTLAGPFRVQALSTPINIGKNPIMAFDYCISRNTFVDLCLALAAGTYYVHFNDSDTNEPSVGSIPATSDGQWHHAEVNLREMVSSRLFQPSMYELSALYFGDYNYAALPPGTEYYLDNFAFVPVVSSVAGQTFRLVATDPSGIRGYSYRWGGRGDHAGKTMTTDRPELTLEGLPEGELYLHLRALDGAGNWSECRCLRYRVDNRPPTFGRPEPSSDEKAAPTEVKVPVTDEGSGVDPATLVLTVNGAEQPLKPQFLKVQKDGLLWEWCAATGLFNSPVANGTRVTMGVKEPCDFAGNKASSFSWSWFVDFSKDKQPPLQPSITSNTAKTLLFHDFTDPNVPWQPWGGDYGGSVERVFDPERKDPCLKLTNMRQHGTMGAIAYQGGYDLVQYPLVSFSYKIPHTVHIHLLFHCNGNWFGVKLTVPSQSYPNIGEVAGIKADGRWHHAWVNAYQLIAKALPGAASYSVSYVCFADYAARDNPAGAAIYVDNFAIAGAGLPQASVKPAGFDPTGIAGYSYVADTAPDTEPATTVNLPNNPNLITTGLGINFRSGINFLHIRAVDGAGNWSATTHYPYLVP